MISFTIGSIFMDLFGFSADSILMFYMVEMDVAKGSKKCPPALKEFLDGN